MELETGHSVREQRWLLGLTLSLVALMGFFAWVNRPPVCLESEVLRRLEWRAGVESYDVFRCKTRTHIGYHDSLAEELPALNRRLADLEQIGSYHLGLNWAASSFIVEVVDEENIHERWSADRIFLSPRQLFETHDLEAEVLGRALRKSFQQPESPSAQMLTRYFLGIAGFASTESRSESQEWKLDLYSEAVHRARQSLGLAEQLRILKEWRGLLSSPEAKAWSLPTELQPGLHASLSAFGYRPEQKLFQIPFAVMWADRSLNLEDGDLRRIQKLVAAIIEPDRIRFPFSEVAFSRLNLAPVQVGRLVLFQCGLPRMEELEGLGLEFEHLLVVQDCGRPEIEKIASSLRNPKNFAKDYPQTDFVQIHWPSLQLAMKKTGGVESTVTDFLRPAKLESFKQVGFLSSIEADEASGTQSWKGAVQPFPLFRLKTKDGPKTKL